MSVFALTLLFTSMVYDFRCISELSLDRVHTCAHMHIHVLTRIFELNSSQLFRMCTLSLIFNGNLSLNTHLRSQTVKHNIIVFMFIATLRDLDTSAVAGNWVQSIVHYMENPTKQHYR